MALHLNLYHEVIKAKALKRRDPLKISIYVLSAIVALCAVWYVAQLMKMQHTQDELARVKAEFDKVEASAKAAKKREEEITGQSRISAQLAQRIEGRFYWAPILSDIIEIVPREVQITRMGGDISGEGLRRCMITIDGLSAGTDPRRVAEDLRTAMAEKFSPKYKNVTSTFKMLEDGTETVMLDGKQMATATFAINVQLYTGEEKSTQPVRKKK
jgi:hypothetical protein